MSDVHDTDAACRRAWDNRLDVRPIIKREHLARKKKRVTGFQTRMICAVGNVHSRTVERWREGRARAVESKRIEDAIRYLNFDIPLED